MEGLDYKKWAVLFLVFGTNSILSICFLLGGISQTEEKRVILGNEIFLKDFPPELKNKRLGLVNNRTSALPDGKLLVEALLEKGHHIKAIFSPEHGFRGTVEGGKEVKGEEFKNIKIYSLYGKSRKPTLGQTQEIDAFIYDIQDVGARFYTYITTLKYVMEAAAKAKIPVYVLDRPNPIGGNIIEGPLLRPEFESFIGALPIPIRYGLTAGELAVMMKGEGWVPEEVRLQVVKIKNWKREYFWKDTGLRWIPPSPNMLTPETAVAYPGIGFLEALNLNEGRGTPFPFLQFGAPWLDPGSLIRDLRGGKPFGIELKPITYTPLSIPDRALHPSYENQECQGVRIYILQERNFFSLRFALSIMRILKEKHPEHLSPSFKGVNIMFGNNLLSSFLEGKISYEKLIKQMKEEESLFKEKRRKYLLYE